ncbi:MAG: hypothetical protein Q9202_003171 [Teloschistes flavicans]
MGKPRMIILIRHAQSEGNKNREIHQTVPDHRVKLTPDGWKQAETAGLKLRSLLRPDDTLHFFTSPYRRTRETTEGILNALTSSNPTPSPFPRHTIKVYEEPRLREQDFGNFQPGSQEMARMWAERAEYGHFFYRIPNGESAADAYDRVSGFNDTLWRSFDSDSFASVCVLVTHGLMTRVFLMKWYHFSVEYFEDLRNIDHCEFVVMKRSRENQKYILQNELRTWSELRRGREEKEEEEEEQEVREPESPVPVRKRWVGVKDEEGDRRRRGTRRQNTKEMFADDVDGFELVKQKDAQDVVEMAPQPRGGKTRHPPPPPLPSSSSNASSTSTFNNNNNSPSRDQPFPHRTGAAVEMSQRNRRNNSNNNTSPPQRLSVPEEEEGGRDGGGSRSGAPSRCGSDESAEQSGRPTVVRNSMAMALHGELGGGGMSPHRARADALGDQSDVDE